MRIPCRFFILSQALYLCDPGDEAVAVGLVAEALPDPMESDGVENKGARSLLRKVIGWSSRRDLSLSSRASRRWDQSG